MDLTKTDEIDLDYEAGLEFLRSTNSGRVAVNGSRYPEIFSVRYAIDSEAIVFRVNGEQGASLACKTAVSFQAEGFDDDRNFRWSIVVNGWAEPMRNLGSLEIPIGFASIAPESREPNNESHWVRIVPHKLSCLTSTNPVDLVS